MSKQLGGVNKTCKQLEQMLFGHIQVWSTNLQLFCLPVWTSLAQTGAIVAGSPQKCWSAAIKYDQTCCKDEQCLEKLWLLFLGTHFWTNILQVWPKLAKAGAMWCCWGMGKCHPWVTKNPSLWSNIMLPQGMSKDPDSLLAKRALLDICCHSLFLHNQVVCY